MGVDESVQLLGEYDAWRIERLSTHTPDVSPAAYMEWRANNEHGRRITEALRAIDGYVLAQQGRGDGMDQEAVDELEEIARILVDGRPFILTPSLTGPSERIFV